MTTTQVQRYHLRQALLHLLTGNPKGVRAYLWRWRAIHRLHRLTNRQKIQPHP